MKIILKKVCINVLLLMIIGNGNVLAMEKKAMALKSCPDSPNCVSSQSAGESHKVSPIAFKGDHKLAFKALQNIVLALPRARVLKQKENSLHIEFRSRWFDFRDDLELFVDEAEQVIHIRSASRVGYWDFGVNRARVEKIRADFYKITR